MVGARRCWRSRKHRHEQREKRRRLLILERLTEQGAHPRLSANANTSVSKRLFPIPGGPSMTSTPLRQRRHQDANHLQLARPPSNRQCCEPLAADIKQAR
jgi:hypothetical protein